MSVIGIILLTAAASSPATAHWHETDLDRRYEKLLKDAIPLLRDGRYDEALLAAGPRRMLLDKPLLELARQAEKRGDIDECLRHYAAYFHYYPFGIQSYFQYERWNKAAFEFTAIRGKQAGEAPSLLLKKDIQAAELYRRLLQEKEGFEKPDQVQDIEPTKSEPERAAEHLQLFVQTRERCAAIADEIIDKYPDSLFCLGAVVSCLHLRTDSFNSLVQETPRHEESEREQMLDRFRAKLAEKGAPARIQLQLLMNYSPNVRGERDRQRMVQVLHRIEAESEVSAERRLALLYQAWQPFGLGSGDPASLDAKRGAYRKFLAKYPDVPESAEARSGLVEIELQNQQPDRALATLRELQRERPEWHEFPDNYCRIIQGCCDAGKKDEVLQIADELIAAYPESEGASRGWTSKAEVFKERKDEGQMLAAYEKAASFPPGVASDTAVSFLGNYYLERRDFPKALTYYRRWKPHSWCVNCLESDRRSQLSLLMLCLLHAGEHREAAELGLSALSGHGGFSESLAMQLFELYDSAGQRRDLLRMTATIHPRTRPPKNAGTAGFDWPPHIYHYAAGMFVPDDGLSETQRRTNAIYALERIYKARDKRDVARLANWCAHSPGFFGVNHPQSELLAKFLAAFGEDAVEWVVSLSRESRFTSPALIYALVLNKDPSAKEALATMLDEMPADRLPQTVDFLRARGSFAKKMLEDLAWVQDGKVGELLAKPHTSWFAAVESDSWPRPKRGSLPKSLPAVKADEAKRE